jgi:hypothetical protein
MSCLVMHPQALRTLHGEVSLGFAPDDLPSAEEDQDESVRSLDPCPESFTIRLNV